jgi:cell division protein ZapA
MNHDARTTSVVILGRDYKIRTTESEEFVHEVAAYVDGMMNRISSKMSSGTTSQIAVLAALNIAEELFRERRNGHAPASASTEENGVDVNDRVIALLHRLDELVESPGASREIAARSVSA